MTPQQIDQMTLSEVSVILGDEKQEMWAEDDIFEVAKRWRDMTPEQRIMQAGEGW